MFKTCAHYKTPSYQLSFVLQYLVILKIKRDSFLAKETNGMFCDTKSSLGHLLLNIHSPTAILRQLPPQGFKCYKNKSSLPSSWLSSSITLCWEAISPKGEAVLAAKIFCSNAMGHGASDHLSQRGGQRGRLLIACTEVSSNYLLESVSLVVKSSCSE